MPERWDVPEDLRRKMVEVARFFRKQPTPTEGKLWQALRNRRLDCVKFRRQQNFGPFVVDFFAAEHRLIVEVDGPIHESQQKADRDRQHLLEALGMRFVRIPTQVVETDMAAALAAIRAGFSPHPPAPSPKAGEGEPEIF